jgi:2-polyprenyl-3-methyl-5-hydroxy-6-metoxy-1,4-benzoquinol methylase
MSTDVQISEGTLPTDEHAFKRWMHQHPITVLQAAGVAAGLRVLDYGCNRGVFTIPAARCVGPSGRVYAADVNAKALEALRIEAGAPLGAIIETLWVADTTAPLDALTTPVDVALLYYVLQAVEDPSVLLRAIHGALTAGGRLSLFPMHIGVDQGIALAEERDLFALESRYGMLLNFRVMRGTS